MTPANNIKQYTFVGMLKLLFIFIGGGLGSLLRFQCSVFFSKQVTTSFPISTFLVNIIGCFLIGIFFGLSLKYTSFSTEWRLLLITGFCGGFTTFSTFAYENLILLQDGHTKLFILYTLGSLVVSILAVLAGVLLIGK